MMQFRAQVKDAKMTSRGVDVHLVAGDDLSSDELRGFMDEAVIITVEAIRPSTEARDVEIKFPTGEIEN